jgi:hypothetical protein
MFSLGNNVEDRQIMYSPCNIVEKMRKFNRLYRRDVAEILPKRRKTQINQSIACNFSKRDPQIYLFNIHYNILFF